jgi:uncharacterized membrane protein
MALAPIEVLVVSFPGNQFSGDILPELERLVEAEIISIVDGVLVRRDGVDDPLVVLELAEIGDDDDDAGRLAALLDQVDALVSDEDVDALAEALEPNSSAAILVFEHTWAKNLRNAIVDSGGVLTANFRVPGLVVEEVLAELAELSE